MPTSPFETNDWTYFSLLPQDFYTIRMKAMSVAGHNPAANFIRAKAD